eukprot:g1551.t1
MLELLLDNEANIEQHCEFESTSLIAACSIGFLEGVKLLVQRGADMNARSSQGLTCLLIALEQRHQPMVSYLLEHESCKAAASSRDGPHLLHYIISLNNEEWLKLLVNKGTNINAFTPDGEIPVFLAVKHCKNKFLRILLDFNADPNVCTKDGKLALHEAIRRSNMKAVKMLIRHGADASVVDKDGLTPLEMTINKTNLQMLELLLDKRVDMEQKSECGLTPLLSACSTGFLEGVTLLVQRGADLNARSLKGLTCLLIAMEQRYLTLATYLLEQESCEINAIGLDGYAALHHTAANLNSMSILTRLICREADLNIQNFDGEVPAFLAVKHGNLNALKMLLEGGADPNICTKEGEFALHEAIKLGNIEAVKLLIKHNADRNALHKSGMSSIEVAEALVPPRPDIVFSLLNDFIVDNEAPAMLLRHNIKALSTANLHPQIEQSICCPITFEVMKDPVIATDGHTYERKAIEQWIREKGESPVTRQPLTVSTLITNLAIKNLIDSYSTPPANS